MHFPRVSPETSFLGTLKQYLGIYPVANKGIQMRAEQAGQGRSDQDDRSDPGGI